MDEKELLLPTYYLHQIGEEISQYEVDKDRWLACAGLSSKSLAHADQQISFSQFKRLIVSAVELSDQPSIGLLVGRRLSLTTHGMLGYAIIASSCLREVLDLFSRYLNTRTPLLRVNIITDKGLQKVEMHECYPLGSIKISFLESAVCTLYNLLMQVTQNSAPIHKITFPFPEPSYQESYHELFDFPVEFGGKVASLSLLDSELDEPLAMADQNSLQQAKKICEQELTKLQNEQRFETRIRKHLLSLESYFPSLIEIAEHFNYSKRTFHRKLTKEGMSYSNILRSVREFKAEELLTNGMTVQQTAFSLGYSDVANFRKAFKRWKGVSPSNYRKKLIVHTLSS